MAGGRHARGGEVADGNGADRFLAFGALPGVVDGVFDGDEFGSAPHNTKPPAGRIIRQSRFHPPLARARQSPTQRR